MMSGHANVDNALASLKLGAFDYLTKPFKVDLLMAAINRANEMIRNAIESDAHESNLALLGESAATQKLKQSVSRVAASASPSLIKGAPGVQKALIASAVHNSQGSDEGEAPFVTFDCKDASEKEIKETLMGSKNKGGSAFENAKGGTLFIENIDVMPQSLQKAFGVIIRESKDQVKLIFATSQNLGEKIASGDFDDSLFYRISALTVEAPALKSRLEDIPLFAKSTLQSLNRESISLSDGARGLLQSYDWLGNFVEFKEVIDEASSQCAANQTIAEENLPDRIRNVASWSSLADYIGQASEDYKKRVLLACQGDSSKAAEILGCDIEEIAHS